MISNLVLIVALTALGSVAVYLILNARIRRSISPAAQIQGLREEVDRLVVELNQTTERNLALLEDRIAELTAALSKADKALGLMRRESEKREVGARLYSRIVETKAAIVNEETASRERTAARQNAASRESTAAPAEAVGNALRDLRAEVLALHNSGLSATLISSRVGAPLGEVELVLALEKRKASR
jgi:hypothetical protein